MRFQELPIRLESCKISSDIIKDFILTLPSRLSLQNRHSASVDEADSESVTWNRGSVSPSYTSATPVASVVIINNELIITTVTNIVKTEDWFIPNCCFYRQAFILLVILIIIQLFIIEANMVRGTRARIL